MKGRAQVCLHGSGTDTKKSEYPTDSIILSKPYFTRMLWFSPLELTKTSQFDFVSFLHYNFALLKSIMWEKSLQREITLLELCL